DDCVLSIGRITSKETNKKIFLVSCMPMYIKETCLELKLLYMNEIYYARANSNKLSSDLWICLACLDLPSRSISPRKLYLTYKNFIQSRWTTRTNDEFLREKEETKREMVSINP
ncbi:hypothetical protein V1478_006764, partial [Vespula squamosa]